MALHFLRSNTLLLLVPKTGSTWIRAMVKQLRLDVLSVGEPALEGHDTLASFDRSRYRMIGAFVRSPITWYRSYWAYRHERGWDMQYPIDRYCSNEDYKIFVRRAVTILPGALNTFFGLYAGPSGSPIDFIGRQECLEEDFRRFLHLAGEDVDSSRFGPHRLLNVTISRPDYTDDLKEIICLSEWETMERFGYLVDRTDAIDFADMRARYPQDAHDLRMLALWTEKRHWDADDKDRAAGRPVPSGTRHARIHRNFALFAGRKHGDLDYAEKRLSQATALNPD